MAGWAHLVRVDGGLKTKPLASSTGWSWEGRPAKEKEETASEAVVQAGE